MWIIQDLKWTFLQLVSVGEEKLVLLQQFEDFIFMGV